MVGLTLKVCLFTQHCPEVLTTLQSLFFQWGPRSVVKCIFVFRCCPLLLPACLPTFPLIQVILACHFKVVKSSSKSIVRHHLKFGKRGVLWHEPECCIQGPVIAGQTSNIWQSSIYNWGPYFLIIRETHCKVFSASGNNLTRSQLREIL